jgi:putative intracellular protease/amidase
MLGHGREGGETPGTHHRTGFDIKEVAHIWLKLHKKMNTKMIFATPRGGEAPVDPYSMQEAEKDEDIRDFIQDHSSLDIFKNTRSLDEIRPDEYSWILLPGCHGAMMDLPNSTKLQEHICYAMERKGCIAAIGHGVAGLINAKTKNGEYFLKDKKMTCFTNEEEREKKVDKMLPYFLEDKVKERGANFQKTKPFESLVVVDEHLITAQNSFSVKDWIKKIMEYSGRGERN